MIYPPRKEEYQELIRKRNAALARVSGDYQAGKAKAKKPAAVAQLAQRYPFLVVGGAVAGGVLLGYLVTSRTAWVIARPLLLGLVRNTIGEILEDAGAAEALSEVD